MLAPPFVAYQTTEFGVTSKRLIDQSLCGRLLGFGSLTLTGTGGVREVFPRVRDPLELRRRIQGQVV